MAKRFVTKKKIAASIVAITIAAVLLLGRTFAWQCISQTALDEYMEVGTNACAESENQAVSLIPGTSLDDTATWTTYELRHLIKTKTACWQA